MNSRFHDPTSCQNFANTLANLNLEVCPSTHEFSTDILDMGDNTHQHPGFSQPKRVVQMHSPLHQCLPLPCTQDCVDCVDVRSLFTSIPDFEHQCCQADNIGVKNSVRCKIFQIEREQMHMSLFMCIL